MLEFVPETVYRASRYFSKLKTVMPMLEVKLYIYQLFRSLAYIHSQGICHRDIKPQNLLLDPKTGVLKLCDFGSAKILVPNEPNVPYICSRYYRAPELIFGATHYYTKIGTCSASIPASLPCSPSSRAEPSEDERWLTRKPGEGVSGVQTSGRPEPSWRS